MRIIEPMRAGSYYHIFNRGINGELLFRHSANYQCFLDKYHQYLHELTETLAYCLLGNHFHLLIYIKEPVSDPCDYGRQGFLVSRQLSHFFNSYAQSFNRLNNRTGGLFESPFRRRLLTGSTAICNTFFMIHSNAQRLGYVRDFRDWPYSSYRPFTEGGSRFLSPSGILQWFESIESFERYHKNPSVTLIQMNDLQGLQMIPKNGNKKGYFWQENC